MTAATITPPPAVVPAPPPPATAAPPPPVLRPPLRRGRFHRLTVAQYHRMIDAGILKSGAKVELVEGLLLRMPMSRNPPHDGTLGLVEGLLRAVLPAGWVVRGQKAVTLTAGEPEPDAAVVLGPDERYLDHHPGPAEIGLVVEVADTTVRKDRGPKLRGYARAGIPVYWIVNLVSREIEVYIDPHTPAKKRPRYRAFTIYGAGQAVPVVLAGATLGTIAVSDVIR